ncbi:hypothetical protein CVT26_010552 [Gymnopilus dilepis]|uniref:Heterokaryon incompatibility domain-containing protein n=1 Tax=Gymnopilus dilepis TaxID=231916 RepID=A0A409VZ96_9AGAR|nr:hypothetical protein CVT26_010552 [Gymnopilus dilepis]
MAPLPQFPLPLSSDGPPIGFGWEGREMSALSTTTAFDTGIDQRDIFLGKRRCIVCGAGRRVVLQHCYIIIDSEPEIWLDLKNRGWIPSQAKALPRHEPRDGLLMCCNHHNLFDAYAFFIRFVPDIQKFVFVNYSNSKDPSLAPFHGKAVALNINDRYAPFPSIFIIHEMRVRGFNPFQPTEPDIDGASWQDWIYSDGVLDNSSDSLKRDYPLNNEGTNDNNTSALSQLQFNPTMTSTSQMSSGGRRVVLNEHVIADILAATRASPSWKACQVEGTSWTGTAEENIQKYFRVACVSKRQILEITPQSNGFVSTCHRSTRTPSTIIRPPLQHRISPSLSLVCPATPNRPIHSRLQEFFSLEGARYHTVGDSDIPAGSCEVDGLVEACDGDRQVKKYKCLIVAGQAGMRVSSTSDGAHVRGECDTVSPVAGWWIFTKLAEREWHGTSCRSSRNSKKTRKEHDDSAVMPSHQDAPAAEGTRAPQQAYKWKFIDANAFIEQGVLKLLEAEDFRQVDFAAISYTWSPNMLEWRKWILSIGGYPPEEKKIRVPPGKPASEDMARFHLFFTVVCFLVLTRGKQFFWMDVLSIDQDANDEKAFFVPKMGSLYASAAETHVYLSGSTFIDISSKELHSPIWETRAWTLQEYLMSRNAIYCYCFNGDAKQDIKALTDSRMPSRTNEVESPILFRYQSSSNNAYVLETTNQDKVSCYYEIDSPVGPQLSLSSYLKTDMFGPNMNKMIGRNTLGKSTYELKHRGSREQLISMSMVLLGGRTSTFPEDMIYSVLGLLEMEDFQVEYGIGLDEAKARVFEKMKPEVLSMILGSDWGCILDGSAKKDSALPRVAGSEPTIGIDRIKITNSSNYTRNVGTEVKSRKERFRLWKDLGRRQTQNFAVIRAMMGSQTSRLMIMYCASLFDNPEYTDIPTSEIPEDVIRPVILSGVSRLSDDEYHDAERKYDRIVDLVEIAHYMPVTFSPAKKDIEPFDTDFFEAREALTSQADRILKRACYQQYKQADEILQSSFDTFSRQSKEQVLEITPQSNGFVSTVLEAYNRHRALVIRPDDVWLAILVQFSAFVNANAETLRHQFVQHEGKKELTVTFNGDVRKVDYGDLAYKMTSEIEKNVTDPILRDWILPDFTTTETNDTIVSSVVMMATMKEYFSYRFMLMCGIPRVTLQGEKADWEKILSRLEKLKEYGLQTIAWYHILRPIVTRFVKAFDAPDAQENLDFWQHVCHFEGGGSGPRYTSGWITAFCVFDMKGTWLGDKFKENVRHPNPASLTASDFTATFLEVPAPASDPFGFSEPQEALTLDGARYHRVDDQDIPAGSCEVDVLIVDASDRERQPIEYKCLMVAGQVGMRIGSSSEDAVVSGKSDTVSPVAGWWIFTKLPEGKSRNQYEDSGEDAAVDHAEAAPVTIIEAGKPPVQVFGGEPSKEKPATMSGSPPQQREEKVEEGQGHGSGCCKCLIM